VRAEKKRVLAHVMLVAALVRVAGAGLVYLLGFRGVSDDDFARVVIAQRFAAAPRLDPTGTSWLPFPFWLVGSAMKLFGSSLEVARVLAVLGAALGSALVAGVACAAGLAPRRAIVGAVVIAAMPWGMQLAVSTVPEAPAAACAAAAAIALASPSSRLRLASAFALLASTLSRYDAWPLAIGFSLLTLLDARRAEREDRFRLILAAVVAALGPVLWSAWQAAVYGDAFRYLRLVRSYRKALGPGPTIAQRLLGYPLGVVEEMREVLGAGIVGLVVAHFVRKRGDALDVRWRRPLSLALLQLVVLVYGDVRDGAPTHHPERALLGPATIVVFAAADAVLAFLEGTKAATKRRVLYGLAFGTIAWWIGLRLHRSLRWYESAPRPREVAAGKALAQVVPKGTRVLLDTRDFPNGGLDYGYYAVIAAFGRPLDVEIDRDQDPRKPRLVSSFESESVLRDRARGARASMLICWGERRLRIAESMGARMVAAEAGGGAEGWAVLALPMP